MNDATLPYRRRKRCFRSGGGGHAYQIYDQMGIDMFRHGRDYPATFEEAETVAELDQKIGVPPAVLEHTIDEFNAAVDESGPFDPRKLDGRATRGITPAKSNWARKIDDGPYRAYPITCGITFTFRGIGIDTCSRVLNTTEVPIQGLYASGEVVGLFFYNYPSCTGQTRNAVFTMTAGRHGAGGTQ